MNTYDTTPEPGDRDFDSYFDALVAEAEVQLPARTNTEVAAPTPGASTLDSRRVASAIRALDKAQAANTPLARVRVLLERAVDDVKQAMPKSTVGKFESFSLADVWDSASDPIPMIEGCFTTSGGRQLMYKGLAWLFAEAGTGKSLVATSQLLAAAKAGHEVIMLDFESTSRVLARRLQQMGGTVEDAAKIHYLRPQGEWSSAELAQIFDSLVDLAKTKQASFILIDGFSVLLSKFGYSESDNDEVTKIADALTDMADTLEVPTLIIDHVGKPTEGGESQRKTRFARGASAKLAAPSLVYRLDQVKSPSKNSEGKARLVITKDRHGEIGGINDTAAWVVFSPVAREVDGGLDIKLVDADDVEANFYYPFKLVRAIADHLEHNTEATATKLREVGAANTKKREVDSHFTLVMDDLITTGKVAMVSDGAKKTYRWVDSSEHLSHDELDRMRLRRLALSKGDDPGL